MKKLLIIVLLSISNSSLAKMRIERSDKAGRTLAHQDMRIAKKSFLAFLRCGDHADKKTKEWQKALHDCMRPLSFSKTNFQTFILWEFMFSGMVTYSEPYQCGSEEEKWIRDQESHSWDLILCFDIKYSDSRSQQGLVFFEKERQIHKITKIKM